MEQIRCSLIRKSDPLLLCFWLPDVFIGQKEESDVGRRHRLVLDWSVVVDNCKKRDTQGRREFKERE